MTPTPTPGQDPTASTGGQRVTQPMLNNRLALRVSEAAELLSVSADTVSRMVRAGELPVVRLRGSVRVPRHALETWLDEKAKGLDSW